MIAWLDSYCKYTKNYANHNILSSLLIVRFGWILIANILKIMRITTHPRNANSSQRLDSYCKYTKNYANHNSFFASRHPTVGWILIANILKIMRITTNHHETFDCEWLDSYCKYTKNYANHNYQAGVTDGTEVGFLLQIY